MDKLSSEVAQALAAGMSYGKWKAKQTPVKIEKKENPKEIRCRNCGAVIKQAGNKSRFYCDAYCGYLYRERMAKENGSAKEGDGSRNCEICGKKFIPKTISNKYCGRECAHKGRQMTYQEWRRNNAMRK